MTHKVTTNVTIKAKYIDVENGVLTQGYYTDGAVALQLHSGSDIDTLTVCLLDYRMTPPEGHVYVKDYGVCEGVPEALIAAGIATPVQRVQYGDYDAAAWLMRLTIEGA